MRAVHASGLKATCLVIIDETGQPATIRKRGRPIARLVSSVPWVGRYPQEARVEMVQVPSDVMAPPLV